MGRLRHIAYAEMKNGYRNSQNYKQHKSAFKTNADSKIAEIERLQLEFAKAQQKTENEKQKGLSHGTERTRTNKKRY